MRRISAAEMGIYQRMGVDEIYTYACEVAEELRDVPKNNKKGGWQRKRLAEGMINVLRSVAAKRLKRRN